MSLIIKKHNNGWRIRIDAEEWEFDNKEQMGEALEKIIDMKEEHGNINQN